MVDIFIAAIKVIIVGISCIVLGVALAPLLDWETHLR